MPTMSLQNRVDRALQSCKFPCVYKLGRGGFNAAKPLDPAWDSGRSDCSGFVSHVIQTRRSPKELRPFWIETTMVYNDATGKRLAFRAIPGPIPGCIVVYGDSGGKQGHMGIVVEVSPDGSYDTVECASGIMGSILKKKAIRRRNDAQKLFGPRRAIFCVLRGDKP